MLKLKISWYAVRVRGRHCACCEGCIREKPLTADDSQLPLTTCSLQISKNYTNYELPKGWRRCSTASLPSYHAYRYLVITPTRLEEMLDNADRTMRDALLAATRMEARYLVIPPA